MNRERHAEDLRINIENLIYELSSQSRQDIIRTVFRRYDARSLADLPSVYYDAVFSDLYYALQELN